MKSKHLILLLVIITFCQCNSTPKNTQADNAIVLAQTGPVNASIKFGKPGDVDSVDPAAACPSGASICESGVISGTPSPFEFYNNNGLLTLHINTAVIERPSPDVYNLLQANKDNGIINFAFPCTINKSIAQALGLEGDLPVGITSPILVCQDPAFPTNNKRLIMTFFGSIPNNNCVAMFLACSANGNDVTACNMNFLAPDQTSPNIAYSTYAPETSTLTLYISNASLNSQGWGAMFGSNINAFQLNTEYTFTDPAIADGMSVPINSTIAVGSYPVAVVSPNNWISITFTLNASGGNTQATK